jgi:hypothetical protein
VRRVCVRLDVIRSGKAVMRERRTHTLARWIFIAELIADLPIATAKAPKGPCRLNQPLCCWCWCSVFAQAVHACEYIFSYADVRLVRSITTFHLCVCWLQECTLTNTVKTVSETSFCFEILLFALYTEAFFAKEFLWMHSTSLPVASLMAIGNFNHEIVLCFSLVLGVIL